MPELEFQVLQNSEVIVIILMIGAIRHLTSKHLHRYICIGVWGALVSKAWGDGTSGKPRLAFRF